MGRPYPSKIRHLGCWAIYALCAIGCLIVTGGAHAAEAARAKRILIISTGSRLSLGFALVDLGILEALGKIPSPRIENSIVRFRPQTLWEEYKWYIIGGLIIIGLQRAPIVGLLFQARRRRHG